MDHDLVNLYDYEASARRTLPHDVWDFIDAGAMDEVMTRRNRCTGGSPSMEPMESTGSWRYCGWS